MSIMLPPADSVRFGMNRCGAVRVSNPKGGWGPDLAVISRTYLSVLLRLGTKTSERVPTSSSYTRRPWIGRHNRPFGVTRGFYGLNPALP